MSLIIGSSAGGIGDNLIFTPIFKVRKDVVMELIEHPKARNIAPLFNGLCSVCFVPSPRGCPEEWSSGHKGQAKLDGLGITGVNCIPQIKLTEAEILRAVEILSDLNRFSKPLIAFVGDNNGSKDVNDSHAHYRLLPYERMQEIINFYANMFTVVQFGTSSNATDFKNVVRMLDLAIRDEAACLRVIGKYFGVDTGDYHLALSVGATATVFVPPPSYFYSHKEWHYRKELWQDEPCRVEYVQFNEITDFLSN